MKIKHILLPAAVLIFYTPAIFLAQTKRAPKGKPKATAPAGPAIPVKYLQNEELKQLLTRNAGQKPLLINFWATWCEPCVEEFPDLVRIDADYKTRGLEFITISLDEKEELTKAVPKFLGRMKSTMPAYLLSTEKQEEAFNLIDPEWPGALPLTLLYDGNGKVVFKRIGKLKIDELRTELDKVVGEKQ
jgi:thiol-disulfide isomerase/thioredoxin